MDDQQRAILRTLIATGRALHGIGREQIAELLP
jgi:hypothetical protein